VNPPVSSSTAHGRRPVVVVGAGPSGLLLAAELARRDVDCTLIDAHDMPLDWDRATVVHARSIEIFEALGMADDLLGRGVKVRGARFRSNGSVLGEVGLEAAGGRYGFDLGLSEEITELLLTRYLEDHGGSVTRGTRLVGIGVRADHVVATVECDGTQRDVEASWVVGCDGFRSTVRQQARIDYPGTDLEAPWAVFDATLEGWNDDGDICHPIFDDPSVILTPLPGERWRVYLRPSSDHCDLVADAATTIRRYAPSAVFVDVENPNRFVCHSRVAAQFRSGRVFLAGDAAHACSPSEGHGMNTGLQDAFNLGWKMALAWHGVGGGALLDSYEAERRPVALRVVATGDAFEGNQTVTAHEARAARDEGIRHMLVDAASTHQEAAAAAEIDRLYASSTVIVGAPREQLAPGELLPNTIAVVSAEGAPCALHELTHRTGHTVLVIGGHGAAPERVKALVAAQEELAKVSPVIDAVFGFWATARQDGIGEIDTAVAKQLGLHGVTVLAVRPDRYIGCRDDGPGAPAMARYVARLTE
jgi:2-polyprenyl-6-methoxyphenol hydroxylase-like FAD-dependent oxidoreductase